MEFKVGILATKKIPVNIFVDFFLSLILIIFVFFVGSQAIKLPWSLVDDGESLRIVNKVSETFPNTLWLFSAEAEHGRLRSVYWLFQIVEFKLFGLNPSLHHLFHIGLFSLAAILLYFLIKKISQNWLAGFFSSSFFIFFSPHFENLYKLGPPEIWLTLLLLVFFWILLKIYEFKPDDSKRITLLILSSFLFFLALLTKETAVVLIPFVLFLGLIFLLKSEAKDKNYARLLFLLGGVFTLLVISLRIVARAFGIQGGYTTFYDFSTRQIYLASKGYFTIISQSSGLLFWILISSFIFEILGYFLIFRKNTDFVPRLILLAWFFFFLAIQLPWFFIMGRYLTPAMIGLSGFFGVQLAILLGYFWQFWRKKKLKLWLYPAVIILILASMVMFLDSNLKQIEKVYKRVIQSEKQNSEVVEYLAKNTAFGKTIYFNVTQGDEYFYEAPLHFDFFYKRSDLKTEILALDKVLNLNSGDLVVSWTRTAKHSEEKILSFLGKRIKEGRKIDEWIIYEVI